MKQFFGLTIFFLFVFCYSPLFSQTFIVGLHGGISVPQLKSSSENEISKDYSSRLAATFGLFADVGLTPQMSIKTAINYAGQGGKRQGVQPVTALPPFIAQMLPPGTMLYADFDNESVLNYLEVPVTIKFTWGSILKYYINAGPYVGILLNSTQKTEGSSQLYFDNGTTQPVSMQGQPLPPQSFNAATDIKKEIHTVNLGLTGGIGFAYSLSRSSQIVLDARAAYGLKAIQKDTQANGKSRTGGLFLTLGYGYALGR